MLDAKTTFSMIKSGHIEFVDFKFTDLRGVWQHMTIPARDFTLENITKGFGFDGSSIRGFQSIYDSDMLLKPDITTVFIDPFFEKTASCICNIWDPDVDKAFPKDPRYTAQKAEQYLKKTGIGDISYWGPELEFFVFDKLAINLTPYYSNIEIKNKEIPNDPSPAKVGSGQEEMNDGYKIANKSGYFPTPPFDKLQAFRSEMVRIIEQIGVQIEVHHHEVSTGGQVEIDMRYDSLVQMADKVMIYKYVARNLAARYGMVACFLPKPIYGDNGTGMHTHQSVFKLKKNVFYDPNGYGEFSKAGMMYIAGVLSHVDAILGFTNPTVNSYRRLVPHYEAPTAVAFSKRNRSAAIRIPMYYKRIEKAKRMEFRCPDTTCNPYLSFAAQLVCGLEGVRAKMDPTKLGFGPFDHNIWEDTNIRQTPNNLFDTLNSLKKDKTLVKSGVFAQELIDSYLEVKLSEAQQSLLYPTPADFAFYGDI